MSKQPRTRLDVDERRNSLLEAAAAQFETRAYDEVSIEDVARAAGVSKGLLYHYFASKRDLYVAHIQRGAAEVLTTITQAVAAVEGAGDDDARLRAALRGWMLHTRAHARTYEAVVRGGLGTDAVVRQIAADLRGHFERLLGDAIRLPVATHLGGIAVLGWLGFVESATLAWIDNDPPEEPDALIDMCVEVLATALAG